MEVRIVSLTRSFIRTDDNHGEPLLPEQFIVYTARVSNPSNQLNTATADKLIRYLIDHKHWSPFDMVNMAVSVKTSRAIAHQILRHWSIKPQEFSQRYAEATSYEPIELRLKADINRQSSTQPVSTISFTRDDESGRLMSHCESVHKDYSVLALRYSKLVEEADSLYKKAIEMNIAAECARFILPLTTQTTIYLNGSVRSWIHYLEQRTSEHAQKEHREVAVAVLNVFRSHFPNIVKALGYE